MTRFWTKETAGPSYDDLLEMLDNVSAIAENMYFQRSPMTDSDKASRLKTIAEARSVCNALLRKDDAGFIDGLIP
jgi:hypothetical protein